MARNIPVTSPSYMRLVQNSPGDVIVGFLFKKSLGSIGYYRRYLQNGYFVDIEDGKVIPNGIFPWIFPGYGGVCITARLRKEDALKIKCVYDHRKDEAIDDLVQGISLIAYHNSPASKKIS